MTARGSATRYARALFDVAVQERVDLDVLQRELAGSWRWSPATRRCRAR